jgi:methionyl-tRNA synthetase
MAHDGRYALPGAIVCNEFYELEHEKVSTSRGHVVWATELMAEVPRAAARFYLALTSPECQRTSFDRDAVETVARRQLVTPWNALADALARATAGLPEGLGLGVTPTGRRRATALAERFALCYDLPTFSLTRAAMTLTEQVARLRHAAEEPSALGDLVLEAETLARCAAPLLGHSAPWPLGPAPEAVRIAPLPSLPVALETRNP